MSIFLQNIELINPRLKSANCIYLIMIVFMTSILNIISSIYSSTIFLSSYPITWLAYLLIVQSIVTILSGFAIKKTFSAEIKRNALIISIMFIVLILACLALNRLKLFWLPFTVSVLVSMVGSLWSLIAWNIAPLAFGFREYKEIYPYIAEAGMAGSVFGSFLVPFLLHSFHLESLLYISISSLVISGICLYMLTLISQITKHKDIEVNNSPFQYSLFINVVFFIMLVVITQSLIDYVFKFNLAKQYSGRELGSIYGYVSGIAGIGAIIIGFITTKYVFRTFSLGGALYIPQILLALAMILFILMPSVWTVSILGSIKFIFYNNYSNYALAVIINILPSAARNAGQIFLKTILTPICTLSIYAFLIFFVSYVTEERLVIVAGTLLFPIFLVIKKIINSYKVTLEHEVEFRRFNIIDKADPLNYSYFMKTVDLALNNQNSDLILFGLSLIDRISVDKLPLSIYKQLNNPDIFVRKSVINYIMKYSEKAALAPLLEQFYIEEDKEIKFWILTVIATLDEKKALEMSYNALAQPGDAMHASVIFMVLKCCRDERLHTARSELKRIASNGNELEKSEAAYIIGEIRDPEFYSVLAKLIHSVEDRVAIAAIRSAAKIKDEVFIPDILSRLQNGQIMRAAKNAITSYGNAALPYLALNLQQSPKNIIYHLKLLVSISTKEADNYLMTFLHSGNIYYRATIIKEMYYRSYRIGSTDAMRENAMRLIMEESQMMQYLIQKVNMGYGLPIVNELVSRLWLTKQRALMLLAIATDPIEIGNLIPALMRSSDNQGYRRIQDKAFELLEIYVENPSVRKKIIEILEPSNPDILNPMAIPFPDTWVEALIQNQGQGNKGYEMDSLLIVYTLRETKLLQKLSGEVLLAIAAETRQIHFDEGKTIFAENDAPDGLYIVCSGTINIVLNGVVINTLGPHQYFGELALIDDSVRTASAIAATDCTLIFLEKSIFDRITDDFPEVLRVVSKVILGYLRQNLDKQEMAIVS